MATDVSSLRESSVEYRIDDSLGYLMRQIVGLSSAAIDERMAAYDLTDAQWKPLLMIRQGKCRTAAEFSRVACADAGAVTRLLDRVEAKGLVRRVRSQADRRVVHLELTDKGVEAADVVPQVIAGVIDVLLAGFTDDESVQLKSMLKRVLVNARTLRDGEGCMVHGDEAMR